MTKEMNQFKLKLDYFGYKGINLDRISLKTFRNFISVMSKKNEESFVSLVNLPTLSLEEVRELTKKFYQKYFSLSDISYANMDQIKRNMEFIGTSRSASELYDRVNSLLVKINPLNLPINFVDGHSMVGEILKPIIITPTGELLRISELTRFNDTLCHYYSLSLKKGVISGEEDAKDLLYIKSTFFAEKLFDMYQNERKQKNKDKYFCQIQDVFDGKIQVEDLIRSRNITPVQTQDLSLLKRHIK